MASTRNNRPAQYRARAQEAREQAKTAPDEGRRNKLLNDAALWERMADYEEKNPTVVLPSYYPPPDGPSQPGRE
jgi:hypothetical protein